MRSALGQVAVYPVTLARSIAAAWNEFWYSPADPTLMGLLRILTGLMLLYTHAVWGLALDDFFGASSWLNLELVRAIEKEQFAYSFWPWVPQKWVWLAHGTSMLVLLCFTVGLWTRLSSILALVVAISYIQREPAALFGLDQINVMLTLYLTIGMSGQALSFDRWLAWQRDPSDSAPLEPSVAANFGQRLIQVHMCVIYFFAGVSKLQGPAWWNGEAMWLAFANQEYQSADMTWLAWHPWILNVITFTTVLWEMSFCLLVWRPLARPLMLFAAVLLHLGIGLCLGMWTFGLIMLVGCASFLPNDGVRKLMNVLMTRRGLDSPLATPASVSTGPSPIPQARSRTSSTSQTFASGRKKQALPPLAASVLMARPRTSLAEPHGLMCELVPVFVVMAQTTVDDDPHEPAFLDPLFCEDFEPRYILVSFDTAQQPLSEP